MLVLAWVIAELFYKFQSFSLETAAFLATWFMFDAAVQGVRALIAKRAADPPRA